MSLGNERLGQGINEECCSPDFVETHPWSQHSLGLFYFGGIIFFFHMQGSKTSVFIKDILFFRLEKITKKGRTNKSLQRRKRPTMCSPWVAILNWFRVLPAAGSLRAASAIPAPSLLHSPCTTHFIPNLFMDLFSPGYFFPPDLSVECSPHSEIHWQAVAYCIILMPLSFLFHKEKINRILAGLPVCPLCSHTKRVYRSHSHTAISGSNGFQSSLLLICLLPSFSPTSNLALSVLTQY